MAEPRIAIDVRLIPPEERSPRIILDAFNSLGSGEALLVINDHDPKPLHQRFTAEFPGAFSWRYLEEGPDTWRIEITKV